MADDKPDDALKNVQFQEGKLFGDWKTGKKIDSGGFGIVYFVTNVADKRIAALKAESNEVEGGSAIKLESMILKRLNANGPIPHVPEVHLVAKRNHYCYMVLTLLGPNLKSLVKKHRRYTGGFTVGTWSRVGIQCLYGLKFVHDNGFVHRDIKPQNFLLGAPEDKERARIVHVLDFGLARPFAHFKDGKWTARRARKTAEFRGTVRYASPNVHEKKEQGRGDDVWSLIYVLVELNGRPMLPWQKEDDREAVRRMKKETDALENMPDGLRKVVTSLEALDYYQRPDYHQLFTVLWKIMETEQVTPSSRYDWEDDDASKDTPPAKWEDPSGPFFSADPIGISQKPPKGALPPSSEQKTSKSSRRGIGVSSQAKSVPKETKK